MHSIDAQTYFDDQSASRKHRKKTTNFWISNESFQDSLIRVRNNINTRKEGHKIIISIPQNYNILAILKMKTFLKFPISDSSMMKLAKIQRFESKVQPWVFHPHPPIWGMKITVIGGDTRWFQPNTNDTRNRIPGWWNKQLLPSGEMLASRKCLHWLERKSCP